MALDKVNGRVIRLLSERVARSLSALVLIVGWGSIAMVVMMVTASLIASGIDIDSLLIQNTINAVAMFICYRLLRKRWRIALIGALFAFSGAIFIAQCLFVLTQTIDFGSVPRAILVKAPGPLIGLMSVAVISLTLRPKYVAVAAGGSIVTLGGLYLIAAMDSRIVIKVDALGSMVGPTVDPILFWADMLFLIAGSAAIFFATVFARRTVFEAAHLQQATDNLSRFFSPNVAASIQENNAEIMEVGGTEQEIVVLFSDLTGFTRASAGMNAREVLTMLSGYQERMVAAIFHEGGTLDKFIGDGIMAIFGAPAPQPDAADRAVRAALAMAAALDELNKGRMAKGQAALAQRIGIHAGPAIVGNMGTPRRLEFTALGDTVNIASRVEGACKTLGQKILVSESVMARLQGRYRFTPQPPIALPGVTQTISLSALHS